MFTIEYITFNRFATPPFINTQSVSLSLQLVDTRAARSAVTNFVGELDTIVSSTYTRRTERFYSTIMRSSHLNYLPKNTTTDSCEIHW